VVSFTFVNEEWADVEAVLVGVDFSCSEPSPSISVKIGPWVPNVVFGTGLLVIDVVDVETALATSSAVGRSAGCPSAVLASKLPTTMLISIFVVVVVFVVCFSHCWKLTKPELEGVIYDKI
jgi:hypothetical protein